MTKKLLTLVSVLFLVSCGTGGGSNDFTNTKALVVDSSNNRVFIFESDKEVYVRTASTNANVGDQPVIGEDEDATNFALMPELVTFAAAYPTSTTTRIFVMGSFENDDGELVLNQIRVFDFDGSSFTQASFSPITLSDGDDDTDETDNTFSGMQIDADNGQLFITDFTSSLLYVIDVDDGTQVAAPVAINDEPQDMALAGDQLFVCHSDDTLTDHVTVVDTSDFSLSTVAIEYPCRKIDVLTSTAGTILTYKRYDAQQVFFYTFNTDTLTLELITASDDSFSNSALVSGAGLTSDVADMVLGNDEDGNVFGYYSELDGNIQFVTFATDLASFEHSTFSTSATNYRSGARYITDDGDVSKILFIAEAGFLISITNGTTTADLDG